MGGSGTILERLRKLVEAVKEPTQDDWDPIELGLLISALEYVDLDFKSEHQTFRDMALKAQDQFRDPAIRRGPLQEQVRILSQVFSEELGFGGDQQNYYNIKNSFLNDVFLRRKGIPISLSLVYMGLAKAVGMNAVGVAFPGHFLLRILPAPGIPLESSDWRRQWYVDPFDGGKILSVEDCEKRLKEWTRGVVPFGPEVLRDAGPGEIVSRLLRNLRAIFTEKEDLPRMYWVLTALVEVCPGDRVDAFKDRGLLLARMGRFGAATEDLKTFLSLSRDLQKISHVERILRIIEGRTEFTN